MKIIFRQLERDGILPRFGVEGCYLKQLKFTEDTRVTTLKTHHHNEYELHLITRGAQTYETEGRVATVRAGFAYIIPPGVRHRMVAVEPSSEKYAISFKYDFRTRELTLPELSDARELELPSGVLEALTFVEEEASRRGELSRVLCEMRLFEGLALLFRGLGLDERRSEPEPELSPPILTMAKQYIADNSESAPSVRDVAVYCHIGEKQLTRIFRRYEGITVFEYIRRERLELAKRLLDEGELTLREISERLGFASEYYFNEFFKKGAGMPPGAYRKTR